MAHAAAVEIPATHYARSGGHHIAYQMLGAGPPDIVFIGGWFSHVEARWDTPLAASARRFTSIRRLIQFDKRGTGLSDPVPLHAANEVLVSRTVADPSPDPGSSSTSGASTRSRVCPASGACTR